LGKPVAVNKYDQKNLGNKSWRSGKDSMNNWGEEIWEDFFGKKRNLQPVLITVSLFLT
jgi:hypothetical protein